MAYKEQAVIGFKDLNKSIKELARAVSGSDLADALKDGAWEIVDQARDNARAQGLEKTGALIQAIRPVAINQYRVDIIVDVPYGATQEFGLAEQRITDLQRRFFWYMWSWDKDPVWRALALSETYTIPAKPYMRPAIDDPQTKKRAAEMTARTLGEHFQKAVSYR